MLYKHVIKLNCNFFFWCLVVQIMIAFRSVKNFPFWGKFFANCSKLLGKYVFCCLQPLHHIFLNSPHNWAVGVLPESCTYICYVLWWGHPSCSLIQHLLDALLGSLLKTSMCWIQDYPCKFLIPCIAFLR